MLLLSFAYLQFGNQQKKVGRSERAFRLGKAHLRAVVEMQVDDDVVADAVRDLQRFGGDVLGWKDV